MIVYEGGGKSMEFEIEDAVVFTGDWSFNYVIPGERPAMMYTGFFKEGTEGTITGYDNKTGHYGLQVEEMLIWVPAWEGVIRKVENVESS